MGKRAADVGVSLGPAQIEAFERYSFELVEASKKFNLTAIPADRYVEDHFVDSLTLLQTGKIKGRCCDIGAGAGLPGLPIKIAAPTIELLLVEANRKKAEFLREVIAKLGIAGAAVYPGRAEEAGRDGEIRESMDIVAARAVAALPILLEYAMPLLKVGGWFLAMKGPGVDQELGAAEIAAAALGARVDQVFRPVGFEPGRQRVIVLAQKVKTTDMSFPRKTGIPVKRPLGGQS